MTDMATLSFAPAHNATETTKIAEPDILVFPQNDEDYDMQRASLLGNGQFSKVYAAPAKLPSSPSIPTRRRHDSVITPPATPKKVSLDTPRRLYAVKVPSSKSSSAVLRDEARILTQLSRDRRQAYFTVAFHGLDERNGALIMDAMPMSLDTYTTKELNALDLESRGHAVQTTYDHFAACLVKGLEWLHSMHIIHADIKPSNILLQPVGWSKSLDKESSLRHSKYVPIYADFSSAIDTNATKTRHAPLGGGTWDFLCPRLLTSKGAESGPDRQSDGWALAMTMLWIIVGDSPYRNAPNAFMRREWIKQGRPFDFIERDDELQRRWDEVVCQYGGLRESFDMAFKKGCWMALSAGYNEHDD